LKNTLSIYLFSVVLLLSIAPSSFAKKNKKNKQDNSSSSTTVTTKKDLELQALFIEGMQAYILGNSQDAITKFNEVLRRDAKNDAALYELSKIAFEAGNMDKSIEFAQNAIKLNPNNEFYYQYLAEAKGEKKDFIGAAKVYENVIQLKPKEYDYYYDWAYMLTKAEKYKDAIEVYDLLEQKTGVQEEVIFQKQPLYIKLGNIEDAVKDIEKLVKLYPSDTRYIALAGELYLSNKMYEKALQTYNRIIAKEPNNADALLAIADIYKQKGDNKTHDEYLIKVFNNPNIDIDTKIMAFIPYIERMAKDSSMRNEVMLMADKLVEAHPNDVKATTARADVLYNSNKKRDAQNEYVKAIHLGADIPNTVWIQLYILDTELEDYDKLIEHTKEGIQKNPNDPFGYFYNAIAQQQKKNNKEASNAILQAFATQQKSTSNPIYTPQLKLQMLILLGDVSFELKDYTRCDSSYEAALEIDPNNATVLNNYAYYLSERDDRLEKAERMSKKSNLLVDNNSAFLDTYAWIMYKMKNYTEALTWIEQAMEFPDAQERAELLTHYGDILFKVGQVDKAVLQWEKALQRGGDKIALELKIKNQKIN